MEKSFAFSLQNEVYHNIPSLHLCLGRKNQLNLKNNNEEMDCLTKTF